MANRVMAAKALKLKQQNRKLPRRLSLSTKGAKGVNKSVLSEYRDRAHSLGVNDDTWAGYVNTPAGKHDIAVRKEEILFKFDNPLFVEHIDNHIQRIRIYFNSRQDRVVIQQWLKRHNIYRISIAYSNVDDAYFVLQHESVTWRVEKNPESVRD